MYPYLIIAVILLLFVAWTVCGAVVWAKHDGVVDAASRKGKTFRVFMAVFLCGPLIWSGYIIGFISKVSTVTIHWILQESPDGRE